MKYLRNNPVVLIFLIAFTARLLVLPFVQTVDADAVSRIFDAKKWLDHPTFISNGIWLPLHFYLNGFVLFIFSDDVYSPKLLHMLIASLTVFPLYYFSRREYSEKGALWISLVYVFAPVVFRNSFHALSEVCFAFFIMLGLNFLSKGIRTLKKAQFAIYGGLAITIASGIRYEAWLLIPFFSLLLLFFKEWKMFFYFSAIAMLFPMFWMIGNYIEYRDMFYGLTGAYNWNMKMEGVNDSVTHSEKIRRIKYFPKAVINNISLVLSFGLIFSIIRACVKKEFTFSKILWTVPFLVLFISYIVKAHNGTLLCQQRFTTNLLILLFPLVSLFYEGKYLRLKQWLTVLIILINLPLSYSWKYPDAKALPMISDRKTKENLQFIRSHANEDKGLILDFEGWDKTFYLAECSKIRYNKIYIVDGSKNGNVYWDALKDMINRNPEGMLLLIDSSKFDLETILQDTVLTLSPINTKLIVEPLKIKPPHKLFLYRKQINN